MKHELKIWPEYFLLKLEGRKSWEFRVNDRDFKAFDDVRLREWNPETKEYTGREMDITIFYVHKLTDNMVILSDDSHKRLGCITDPNSGR